MHKAYMYNKRKLSSFDVCKVLIWKTTEGKKALCLLKQIT